MTATQFDRGQRVWTPEFGWVRYERELKAEADTSYDSHFRKIRTSTIELSDYKPDAAARLVPYVLDIYITDSDLDAGTEWLSSNSKLTPTEAVDYIRESPRGHRMKCDIRVKDETPSDILRGLGVALDSRNLAGFLMREHGLTPHKQA